LNLLGKRLIRIAPELSRVYSQALSQRAFQHSSPQGMHPKI
jgi:hypothetical protein